MKLYHGSNVIIENPNLEAGRKNIDFGQGFYLTTEKSLAKKWACGRHNDSPHISEYYLGLQNLTIYCFGYNQIWLDYVICNRLERELPESLGFLEDVDVLLGPVVDDKLFKIIELYENGLFSAKTAVKLLTCLGYSEQIVLKSEKSLKLLEFVNGEKINEKECEKYKQKYEDDRKRAEEIINETISGALSKQPPQI